MTQTELLSYDKYLVQFSGGKDSTACFLHLLDQGVPKERIELWHQLVDGPGKTWMDWEITESYCQAFARAFGVPIHFSWKEGGFRQEAFRDNARTAPTTFQLPGGSTKTVGGTRGKLGTRMKFPQISPDLSVRWCSAYLKIDVCSSAIRNQDRFEGIRTLVISGERGEESAARAKYAILEPDRADNRGGKRVARHVDRWRPIRDWPEEKVWDVIQRWAVRVHPAYYLGFSRCSCQFCIFGNADQFFSAYLVSPDKGDQLIADEELFGMTMKRQDSLADFIMKGKAYPSITPELTRLANSREYNLPIIMEPGEWLLPAGAYGEGCGPS